MSRSPIFDRVARAMRIARFCERHGISTSEGLERIAALEEKAAALRRSRREFLGGIGKATAFGAVGAAAGPALKAFAAPPPDPDLNVGIVGAGLAGLTCADTLRIKGVSSNVTIYEARDRVGGRQFSTSGRDFPFPAPNDFGDRVIERGGEFIDNLHKTLLGYAQEFGLAVEDMNKEFTSGPDTFFFLGQHRSEAEVVDEFRALVDAMRPDLAMLSSEITVDNFTEFDKQIDETSLRQYLEDKGAGDIVKAAIDVAYNTEYGLEIEELSALDFIFFIHIDKRSKWVPFGVFSDERFHVVDGNQQISQRLADRQLAALNLEHRLVRARKTAAGQVELTFKHGNTTVTNTHEAVVFALPFSILREVELDPNLGLGDPLRVFADGRTITKLDIINEFLYGTNAKLHIGFDGPFWRDIDPSLLPDGTTRGETFSDLRNHQLTWESNPIKRTEANAVQVDYSGGKRGAGLNKNNPNHEAKLFLTDFDLVLPGALDAARRTANGKFIAFLDHWPSDPFVKGSYTANQPGYFTTIAGLEAEPVGNLFFAGEHTDSFYEFQGFMEGAATSGIRAAGEVLAGGF